MKSVSLVNSELYLIFLVNFIKIGDVDNVSITSFFAPFFLQHKFTLDVTFSQNLLARLLGKTVATCYYALSQILLNK